MIDKKMQELIRKSKLETLQGHGIKHFLNLVEAMNEKYGDLFKECGITMSVK